MATSGQGTLVNVCDGKAPCQHPVWTPAGLHSQQWARMGQSGHRKPQGAGAASETVMPEGETESQKGEGPRLGSHSKFVV